MNALPSTTSTVRVAAWSDQGKERDYQEDNYCVGANPATGVWVMPGESFAPGPHGVLLVVADGMGGLNAGEIASSLAVEGVKEFFAPDRLPPTLDGQNPGELLTACILYANDKIVEHARRNTEAEGMGTTLAVAWILGNTLYVGWCGDSRCYLLRGGQIRQIGKDHSYVQELIDKQLITDEEAFFHPNKNIITQSLGDVGRPPVPECTHAPLEPGDRILVCSDGLNSMLHDYEIAPLLAAGDISTTARALVDAANDAGGHDNITVVIGELEGVAVQQPVHTHAPNPMANAIPPKGYPQRLPTSTKTFAAIVVVLLLGLLVVGAVMLYNLTPQMSQALQVPPGDVNDTTHIHKASDETPPFPRSPQVLKPKNGIGGGNGTDPALPPGATEEIKEADFKIASIKHALQNQKRAFPTGICNDKLGVYEREIENNTYDVIKKITCSKPDGCGFVEFKKICGCDPNENSSINSGKVSDFVEELNKKATATNPVTVSPPLITEPAAPVPPKPVEKYGVQIASVTEKRKDELNKIATDKAFKDEKISMKKSHFTRNGTEKTAWIAFIEGFQDFQSAKKHAEHLGDKVDKKSEKPFPIIYTTMPDGSIRKIK